MTTTAAPAATTLTPVEPMADLVESNDLLGNADAMLRRLNRDGYLFFRGILPRQQVLDARRRIMTFCQEEGWLRPGSDVMEGLTDHAPVLEGAPEWRPVYLKTQKCEQFHALKLNPTVRRIMEAIFDEQAVALPMTIARMAFPRCNDHATQPHQDWIYVQGSMNTISCWATLGDVPAEVGGLKILEGSHKAGFLVPRKAQGPGGNTVDCDPRRRWLATNYRAGDVLMFTPLTVHGARANVTSDRIRLSIDFRWTGVSHGISESWLKPHFHWLGPDFQWDNLDKDWKDQSLRRYWEKVPNLYVQPHENRVYAS